MRTAYFLLTALIVIAGTANATERDTLRGDNTPKELQEVKVSASHGNLKRHVESTQMGKLDIPVSLLSKAPSLAGEPDIIKALQLTPGVKRGSEGSIGMYVRGGGNDENLILLDGAPVYNAGHLLGFFSVFNSSSIKDVQLYKSCFPAQYGGRLSSVLDVKTKEGSLNEFKANGSLGAISSAMTVQGPIINDKLSFIVSGRRTYIDKIFKYIPYHFYDVNTKLTYVMNSRNRLYLSSYIGEDILKTPSGQDTLPEQERFKTGMKLGNQTATLRWNHMPEHGKFSSDLSVMYTRFRYDMHGNMGNNTMSMKSAIQDMGIKGDIRINNTGDHKLTTGFSATHHYFNPNVVSSAGALVERFGNSEGEKLYTTKGAVYANDDYKIDDKWQANAGLRMSSAAVAGKTYINAEPRIGLRYLLNDKSSIKASYARMTQYMHLVSSSSLVLPTDLWYPVTANIKPGKSDQVSAGYYYSIPGVGVSLSAEVYYKWMQHLTEYREGALLIGNSNYENEMVQGKGRSYGLELFASKTTGKFTGWVGYTFSYSHRKFDELNEGKEYYSRFDRRHDISLVGMYDISKHWGISTSVLYATGNPFTGQASQYMVPKPDFSGFDILPAYTGRNDLRMSASFRIDLDLQYKFRLGKHLKGDAHLSIYNVMNRAQPHRVERTWNEKKQAYTYQQTGLFGTITTGTINFNL
ncbi:MAG: hypothetical protein EOP56_12840 [Sphingobacteriales bacterium]|nr:MAG: hypothetical protein EOP56_12840 [Sphingobacteriales bacterium]